MRLASLGVTNFSQTLQELAVLKRFCQSVKIFLLDIWAALSTSAGIAPVDPGQPNWPAVSTVLSSDGSLRSSPLYDMLPPLPAELLERVGRYLPES
jgi:hypothetical protein